jgi:hypothetical protein
VVQFVQITTQYSNAVLLAVLPHVSEFSQNLGLALPTPVTPGHVRRFNCDPHRGQVGGWISLTNGFEFWFADGYVKGFAAPDCWYRLQDAPPVGRFQGRLRLRPGEAIALGRASLRKLGYPEADLYVDGVPKLTGPPTFRSSIIPRYRLQWPEPVAGGISVEMEVDGDSSTLKSLMIINENLARDPPEVSVTPESLPAGQPPEFLRAFPEVAAAYHDLPIPSRVTAEKKQQLLAEALARATTYCGRLNLPFKPPLTTNDVRGFDAEDYPDVTLTLNSGHRFVATPGYLLKYSAPSSFFGRKLEGSVTNYWGVWRMTEKEAVGLARASIRNLGLLGELPYVARRPQITKPLRIGQHDIPRYRLNWCLTARSGDGGEAIVSGVEVEVDGSAKTVKSIIVYDPHLASSDTGGRR